MRKAKFVALHTGFFLPGGLGGDMPSSLPPANKNLPNLELYLLDSGQVQMSWTHNGLPQSFVIGAANVKGALLDMTVQSVAKPSPAPKKPEPPKAA